MVEKFDQDKKPTRRSILQGLTAGFAAISGAGKAAARLEDGARKNFNEKDSAVDLDLFKIENEQKRYQTFISQETAAIGELLSGTLNVSEMAIFYQALETFALLWVRQTNGGNVLEGLAEYVNLERYIFRFLQGVESFPQGDINDGLIKQALLRVSKDAQALLEKKESR